MLGMGCASTSQIFTKPSMDVVSRKFCEMHQHMALDSEKRNNHQPRLARPRGIAALVLMELLASYWMQGCTQLNAYLPHQHVGDALLMCMLQCLCAGSGCQIPHLNSTARTTSA